jgi:6-phosphogluconolactonase (cycloisomerase 2 family)
MRLGLIGGTDSKRTGGVYQPEDVVALQDAKKYVSRFGYDGVFNALTNSGVEEGFDVSRDGRYVYVAVRGDRLTAAIFQYECSTPWDLATITYSSKSLVVGDYEIQCNGIAITDDGTRLYFTGHGGDTVWSCTLSTPYDLATATVDVKKFYVGGQDLVPNTPFFGDSGTKMYVMGDTNDRVYQYNLATAWDVTTASYTGNSLLVTALSATPTGLFFKDDGTKLYIAGATQIVASYTLSTAWDVSTGTADYVAKSFSVAAQVTAVNTFASIFIGDSGTKMYALAGYAATTDTIFQYTLSTAWDITTASYASKSFSVNTQEITTGGMFFKDDGTKLYTVGFTNDTIYQYTLSTAWDISTASYDSVSFSVAGQEATPTGLFFDSSGTRMYVTGFTGTDVNQYSLSTAWDISTASFVRVSAAVGDTAPRDVFFKDDGTKMYIVGGAGVTIREFTLSTAWDVSTISFVRAYSVFFLDSVPLGLFFKNDGTKIYIAGATNRTAYQLSLTTAWNSGSVTGRFFVGNEETGPRALFFKPDGTKMFVIGQTGDDVNEYDLSTAWNVSTASFVRVSAAVGETAPTGLWFKDDGTKMYVTGYTNDTVREFTLSTAWNVSTIAFVQLLSIGFETAPTGVTFKDDGTELYVLGQTNDTVYEIQLGTAWDISTAKGFVYVGGTEPVPRGIHINSDGTLLFLSGNGSNQIRKFTLSTAYELASATLSQSFAVTGIYSAFVTADGMKIYAALDFTALSPSGGRRIAQIDLTSPYNLSTATLAASPNFVPLFGVTGPTAAPWGVRVSPDGTRMFVLSDNVQGLHQFSRRFA